KPDTPAATSSINTRGLPNSSINVPRGLARGPLRASFGPCSAKRRAASDSVSPLALLASRSNTRACGACAGADAAVGRDAAFMGKRNLAATGRADVDVGQPLRHLSSGFELMRVNMTWRPARRGVLTLALPRQANGNARRITAS